MNSIKTKMPAKIGMAISILSFGLLICALIISIFEKPNDDGIYPSFAFGAYSVIVILFGLFFYFIDAVLSIIKAFMKIDPVFNGILAVLLLGAIPMVVFVGGGLGINVLIWNLYHLGIFVLEIVSIVRCTRADR